MDWLSYFHQAFPRDTSQWLYHEPIGQLNWGTRKIFSAKYARGDDLDIQRFLQLEQEHCDQFYHEHRQQDRYLPVFWHKSNMPCYFARSKSIVIRIDPASLRWYDHAVYHKHHSILAQDRDGVLVRLLENRPEVVIPEFKNAVDFERRWPSFRAFVEERILGNPFRYQYRHTESMPAWSIPSVQIDLSDLLDKTRIGYVYHQLCGALEITPVLDNPALVQLHGYWRDLHAI